VSYINYQLIPFGFNREKEKEINNYPDNHESWKLFLEKQNAHAD
jgi:hypothetical protein